MQLSNCDLRLCLKSGALAIHPYPNVNQFGSASIDLRLGNVFKIFKQGIVSHIDLAPQEGVTDTEALMYKIECEDGEAFYLHPGMFALGITKERVVIGAEHIGHLDGRSSLARVGLNVHATAHTIDPGWDGAITLEFSNTGPHTLVIRPGMRICALQVSLLTTASDNPYKSKSGAKYTGQYEPVASKISADK